MALSLSSTSTVPYTRLHESTLPHHSLKTHTGSRNVFMTKCTEAKDSSAEPAKNINTKLEIGSPIIVTEAPKMIKTATSVPCLRVNSGLVKPGDVGRIMSRKPKDVWAVRLAIGTYLIDGKYFKPLEELNE